MGWLSGVVAGPRRRPVVVDALLAVGLAAVCVLLIVLVWFYLPRTGQDPTGHRPGALLGSVGFTLVSCLPLVVRRRYPWLAAAGAIVLQFSPVVLPASWLDLAFVPVLLISYAVAAHLPLWPAVAATVAISLSGLAASLSKIAVLPMSYRLTLLGFGVSLQLACFVLGRYSFTRRAYLEALEERARTAVSNQRTLARQAVGDERRRIARELHDVVAHHVSAMGVLATGARRMLARDPAAVDKALGTIEQTGRTTLRELRRLLNLLRADDEEPGELLPQPGLSAVTALVEGVQEAGLPVDVRIDGEPYPLDAGTALTVYRVIQEALTNTVKHAGPARAQVRLGFAPDALTVEVFDTGRGEPEPAAEPGPPGHGLVGMRERVALYGGQLRTGPRPGGGFRVYARIPMDSLDGLGGSS